MKLSAAPLTLTVNGPGCRFTRVFPTAVGREITPETTAEELRAIAAEREIKIDPAWDAEKLVTELFGEIVEPTLIQPTFVCDYPPSAQPLARPHRDKPNLIEAWDLIIDGRKQVRHSPNSLTRLFSVNA